MSVGPRQAGGGGGTGAQINSSILTQGSQTTTFLAFEATTSIIVATSTSMSNSQVVSTTATTLTSNSQVASSTATTLTRSDQAVSTTSTTLTVSTSATITATSSITPTASPSPTPQNDTSLLHDGIIIASVLGSFAILLICGLTFAYYLRKRLRRQRDLDYSPPFTSLAPPPRSALSALTIRSSPIAPSEPRETSLSMGPGPHPPAPDPTANQRPSSRSTAPRPNSAAGGGGGGQNVPVILLQATPPQNASGPSPARAQSRLYHELLREESDKEAAARRQSGGGLEAPGPLGTSAARPISGLSDISDLDGGHGLTPPSGEGGGGFERGGLGGGPHFPLTRASSGVFPDGDD